MHRVPLRRGDTRLVPAGLPHAIGPGITLVELQQPVDLSILLEYAGHHGEGPATSLMGLQLDEALEALDGRAWPPESIATLAAPPRRVDSTTEHVFPKEADSFFRADHLLVTTHASLDSAFSIVIVLAGTGILEFLAGSLPVSAGTTFLIPHGAGPVDLVGELELIRARPPLKAVPPRRAAASRPIVVIDVAGEHEIEQPDAANRLANSADVARERRTQTAFLYTRTQLRPDLERPGPRLDRCLVSFQRHAVI